MKKILFMLMILGAYSYIVFSGEEELWLSRGKSFYQFWSGKIRGNEMQIHINREYNDLPSLDPKENKAPEKKNYKSYYKSKRRISYRY